jgi:hypothetical protein
VARSLGVNVAHEWVRGEALVQHRRRDASCVAIPIGASRRELDDRIPGMEAS